MLKYFVVDKHTQNRWMIIILCNDSDTCNVLVQESHASEERAVEQVREGKAWAALIVGQNFTVDLFKRITDYSDRSVIKGSTIELYIDNTSELGLELMVCVCVGPVWRCYLSKFVFIIFILILIDSQISAVIGNNTAYAFEVSPHY